MAEHGATDTGMNIQHTNPPPYPSQGRPINPCKEAVHIKGRGDVKPVSGKGKRKDRVSGE